MKRQFLIAFVSVRERDRVIAETNKFFSVNLEMAPGPMDTTVVSVPVSPKGTERLPGTVEDGFEPCVESFAIGIRNGLRYGGGDGAFH